MVHPVDHVAAADNFDVKGVKPYRTCPAGQYLQGYTATKGGVCTMCGAGKFKTQAMSTSYKVPCRPWTTCTNGEYVQAKGTTTSDAVCASHSAPCKADQYESKKPTVNSDRQCKGAGSCKNGMLITPARRTQADHCGICNVGFRLNNKACLKNTCKCSNGKFPTVCPKDGATACVSCNPGYILDKTKTCLEKKCSCANGIPLTGTKCPAMGLLGCAACNSGFVLGKDGLCGGRSQQVFVSGCLRCRCLMCHVCFYGSGNVGCTHSAAVNYKATATEDDGSCRFGFLGLGPIDGVHGTCTADITGPNKGPPDGHVNVHGASSDCFPHTMRIC
eukprot:COSAG01_NODE_4304_length_5158_cov_3.753509_4_plen_331_part_00